MNIIKGNICIQRGGLHGSINDKCNLVTIVGSNLVTIVGRVQDYAEVDFILYHEGLRQFVKETCFLLHKRLSIPTFSDVLKCGDTINPKYKLTLKKFLEELANV